MPDTQERQRPKTRLCTHDEVHDTSGYQLLFQQKVLEEFERLSTCAEPLTSHLRQLSLPSLRGRLIEYKHFWPGLSGARMACVGWQITLCETVRLVT